MAPGKAISMQQSLEQFAPIVTMEDTMLVLVNCSLALHWHTIGTSRSVDWHNVCRFPPLCRTFVNRRWQRSRFWFVALFWFVTRKRYLVFAGSHKLP